MTPKFEQLKAGHFRFRAKGPLLIKNSRDRALFCRLDRESLQTRTVCWRGEFELVDDFVNGQEGISIRQSVGTAGSNLLRSAKHAVSFGPLSFTARKRLSCGFELGTATVEVRAPRVFPRLEEQGSPLPLAQRGKDGLISGTAPRGAKRLSLGDQAEAEQFWRKVLTEGHRPLRVMHRIFRHLPSPPRCKVCHNPFGGVGGKLVGLLGFPPSRKKSQSVRYLLRETPTGRR